ncbi:hypothetical protein EDB89DRAFT_1908940 [Lactarius sanguifluus]|nr:hypothetical protein EDB89DRAFT_1908940 [Lactarius sanguifluus]
MYCWGRGDFRVSGQAGPGKEASDSGVEFFLRGEAVGEVKAIGGDQGQDGYIYGHGHVWWNGMSRGEGSGSGVSGGGGSGGGTGGGGGSGGGTGGGSGLGVGGRLGGRLGGRGNRFLDSHEMKASKCGVECEYEGVDPRGRRRRERRRDENEVASEIERGNAGLGPARVRCADQRSLDIRRRTSETASEVRRQRWIDWMDSLDASETRKPRLYTWETSHRTQSKTIVVQGEYNGRGHKWDTMDEHKHAAVNRVSRPMWPFGDVAHAARVWTLQR